MLQLKPKQQQAVDAVNDPLVDTLVLFGTVGTGKTDIAAHIVISICYRFDKTYWPVFRQNISTAKKSVIPSYLEMLDKMGLVEGTDYKFNSQEHTITFTNKSVIVFTEADPTKDRGGKKIKGINASGNHCDEVDELTHEMFVQAVSRKGRRNASGQPSISILTFNPTDVPHLITFYNKYKKPETYGALPSSVRCIEFGLEDSWQQQQDIDQLKTNPKWWTERYLYNNWAYADESSSLFKSKEWAASLTDKLDGEAKRVAGYDVARSGVDRSVRAVLYGLTVADIKIFKDKLEQIDTSKQGDMLITDAAEEMYALKDLAVDAVGLGVGVVDALSKEGYKVVEYMSGKAPDPGVRLSDDANVPINFDSLRSQMIYLYARGLELGLIKHYSGCPFLNDLQKEATMHNYEITDKVLKVESKEHIKKRLGVSPDLFDAVIMAFYIALRRPKKVELGFV
jgi:hypothetical protein